MRMKRYDVYHDGIAVYMKFVRKKCIDKATIKLSLEKLSLGPEIKIGVNNRGYKMLVRMGWDGKHELGPHKIKHFKDPIKPIKQKRRWDGVGFKRR